MKEGNGGVKKQQLVVVLIALLILAVGLVVAISLVGRRGEEERDTEEESFDMTLEEELIENDKSYQISLDISNVYNNDGDKEKALEMYDEELSKALSEQDYDLYVELLIRLISHYFTINYKSKNC